MEYIMKCPMPDDIAQEILGVIKKIRRCPIQGLHTTAMVDTLVNAINASFDYYFITPLKIMEAIFF